MKPNSNPGYLTSKCCWWHSKYYVLNAFFQTFRIKILITIHFVLRCDQHTNTALIQMWHTRRPQSLDYYCQRSSIVWDVGCHIRTGVRKCVTSRCDAIRKKMAPAILFTTIARRLPNLTSHTRTSWLPIQIFCRQLAYITVIRVPCICFTCIITNECTINITTVSLHIINTVTCFDISLSS
jgi:hypothetical protein